MLPVFEAATSLVVDLGIAIDLTHLHVAPIPSVGFALSPAFQLAMWPSVEVRDRSVTDYHEHLKVRMHQRAAKLAAAIVDRGGVYQAELWHGNVAEEIARATETLAVDLSIFGQHRTLHKQPLALGQMPFDAMLRVGGAILVAPESRH
jgi:hypothetical protein